MDAIYQPPNQEQGGPSAWNSLDVFVFVFEQQEKKQETLENVRDGLCREALNKQ